MHDEDNDGRFPDQSPVEVRYPRSKQEEQGDRERWPWLPGTIVEQCGPDEWYVCIEVRELAVLRDGRSAPRGTASRNLYYPCRFRDSSEIRPRPASSGPAARLLPLSVDGLILAASLVLLHEARNDRDAPRLARFMLWLGIAATIGEHRLRRGIRAARGADLGLARGRVHRQCTHARGTRLPRGGLVRGDRYGCRPLRRQGAFLAHCAGEAGEDPPFGDCHDREQVRQHRDGSPDGCRVGVLREK